AGCRPVAPARCRLAACGPASMPEPQVLDQGAIPLEILPLQILQKPTPATDHLEQAATAVVVLGVFPEMIRQLVDPGRQQCDLDRRAAAVFRMQLVLLDDFFLIEPHLGSASARVYAGREASPLLAYHA